MIFNNFKTNKRDEPRVSSSVLSQAGNSIMRKEQVPDRDQIQLLRDKVKELRDSLAIKDSQMTELAAKCQTLTESLQSYKAAELQSLNRLASLSSSAAQAAQIHEEELAEKRAQITLLLEQLGSMGAAHRREIEAFTSEKALKEQEHSKRARDFDHKQRDYRAALEALQQESSEARRDSRLLASESTRDKQIMQAELRKKEELLSALREQLERLTSLSEDQRRTIGQQVEEISSAHSRLATDEQALESLKLQLEQARLSRDRSFKQMQTAHQQKLLQKDSVIFQQSQRIDSLQADKAALKASQSELKTKDLRSLYQKSPLVVKAHPALSIPSRPTTDPRLVSALGELQILAQKHQESLALLKNLELVRQSMPKFQKAIQSLQNSLVCLRCMRPLEDARLIDPCGHVTCGKCQRDDCCAECKSPVASLVRAGLLPELLSKVSYLRQVFSLSGIRLAQRAIMKGKLNQVMDDMSKCRSPQ